MATTMAERVLRILVEKFDGNRDAWSKASGVTRQQLNTFLTRAKKNPRAVMMQKTVEALASAAGCDYIWLLAGTGEPFGEPPLHAAHPAGAAPTRAEFELLQGQLSRVLSLVSPPVTPPIPEHTHVPDVPALELNLPDLYSAARGRRITEEQVDAWIASKAADDGWRRETLESALDALAAWLKAEKGGKAPKVSPPKIDGGEGWDAPSPVAKGKGGKKGGR